MIERDLYIPIANWLSSYLKDRYAGRIKAIHAEDTHSTKLCKFIEVKGLSEFFPEHKCYDVQVDVTGVVLTKDKKTHLAIVEVKTGTISISSFSQILGYSKIVRPDYAFIISPKGWSISLQKLVAGFARKDILCYFLDRYLVVAQWDMKAKTVKSGDILR